MDFINHLHESYGISLNEQQARAVLTLDGPILLLAVPGAGKTTVIVSRCANMILNHSILPESILTLTFSRASAHDMKNRFTRIFGCKAGADVHFSTIHSFCFSAIREHYLEKGDKSPQIIEDEKASVSKQKILKQLYLRFNNEYANEDKLEELSNSICYAKNMMMSYEDAGKHFRSIRNFYNIIRAYDEYKDKNNYADYDDLLSRTLDILNQNKRLADKYRAKYKYINVDESQDTSYIQHEIIKCLAAPRNNIFMVGDEDQSIYGFRAAFPKALLDFEQVYPGAQVLKMERNYRSANNIVRAANHFIKQNKERVDKNMFSGKPAGDNIRHTSLKNKEDQYSYLAGVLGKEKNLSGTCVLYRNNISVIPLADTLERRKIPFYIREHKVAFFKHWITKDILAFINFALNPGDIDAFSQIYYKMNAYISRAMFEYSAAKQSKKRELLDILLFTPDISQRSVRRINELKHSLKKLTKLPPERVISSIEDSLGYTEYLKNKSEEGDNSYQSFLQIINSLKFIASNTSSMYEFKARLESLENLIEGSAVNRGGNAVTLSTVHSCKGLEFDKVFIFDLIDGQFPSAESIRKFDEKERNSMEEEVRLFYVAATRAKKYLELLSAQYSGLTKLRQSRFIEQLLAPEPSLTT